MNLEIKNRARNLRQAQTNAEQLLWSKLRNRYLLGYKFRRQYKLWHYIVDFVCFESKLIVELDGGQHLDRKDYDAERTAFLNEIGFTVLRFWNNEVFNNPNIVLEKISQVLLDSPSSGAARHLLPQGEKES